MDPRPQKYIYIYFCFFHFLCSATETWNQNGAVFLLLLGEVHVTEILAADFDYGLNSDFETLTPISIQLQLDHDSDLDSNLQSDFDLPATLILVLKLNQTPSGATLFINYMLYYVKLVRPHVSFTNDESLLKTLNIFGPLTI